jgi:hypothetical protein
MIWRAALALRRKLPTYRAGNLVQAEKLRV